ncbi:unnamed protein product [Ectocarpus sp. 4 AP-2014]
MVHASSSFVATVDDASFASARPPACSSGGLRGTGGGGVGGRRRGRPRRVGQVVVQLRHRLPVRVEPTPELGALVVRRQGLERSGRLLLLGDQITVKMDHGRPTMGWWAGSALS